MIVYFFLHLDPLVVKEKTKKLQYTNENMNTGSILEFPLAYDELNSYNFFSVVFHAFLFNHSQSQNDTNYILTKQERATVTRRKAISM
jgi:hypothetical protein